MIFLSLLHDKWSSSSWKNIRRFSEDKNSPRVLLLFTVNGATFIIVFKIIQRWECLRFSHFPATRKLLKLRRKTACVLLYLRTMRRQIGVLNRYCLDLVEEEVLLLEKNLFEENFLCLSWVAKKESLIRGKFCRFLFPLTHWSSQPTQTQKPH